MPSLLTKLNVRGGQEGREGGGHSQNFWILENRCAFYKHTKFAIVVFDCVLGALRLAPHTWRLPSISVVLELHRRPRSRAFEGRSVSSKIPSRVQDTGDTGGTEEKIVSQTRGNLFAPQAI